LRTQKTIGFIFKKAGNDDHFFIAGGFHMIT
jgi:hypothetical protein